MAIKSFSFLSSRFCILLLQAHRGTLGCVIDVRTNAVCYTDITFERLLGHGERNRPPSQRLYVPLTLLQVHACVQNHLKLTDARQPSPLRLCGPPAACRESEPTGARRRAAFELCPHNARFREQSKEPELSWIPRKIGYNFQQLLLNK